MLQLVFKTHLICTSDWQLNLTYVTFLTSHLQKVSFPNHIVIKIWYQYCRHIIKAGIVSLYHNQCPLIFVVGPWIVSSLLCVAKQDEMDFLHESQTNTTYIWVPLHKWITHHSNCYILTQLQKKQTNTVYTRMGVPSNKWIMHQSNYYMWLLRASGRQT